MIRITPRRVALKSLHLPLGVLVGLVLVTCTHTNARYWPGLLVANAQTTKAKAADEPVFRDYKGVHIGMTAKEARQKLGDPREKSDAQDFFVFSEKEMAQIYYDGSQTVTAISVDYMNGGSNAPAPKAVLGTEIEAKEDGSMYKMVRYPKAGYWVSYSRTAGSTPLITVTIQKIAQGQ